MRKMYVGLLLIGLVGCKAATPDGLASAAKPAATVSSYLHVAEIDGDSSLMLVHSGLIEGMPNSRVQVFCSMKTRAFDFIGDGFARDVIARYRVNGGPIQRSEWFGTDTSTGPGLIAETHTLLAADSLLMDINGYEFRWAPGAMRDSVRAHPRLCGELVPTS